jgi:hypothetical protein
VTGQPPRCGHWDGARRTHCGAAENVRPFLTGLCCPAHTPAAVAGRPEPQPGPGWPAAAWSTPTAQGVAAVIDQRAIASGKRRSSAGEYRAAQAAITPRRPATSPELRVDLGDFNRRTGRWVRFPAADYRCRACGFSDSASGDQVAHFAAHIEDTHRATCPALQKGTP